VRPDAYYLQPRSEITIFAQSNQATFLGLRVSRFQESKKEINAASNMAIKISNKQ
jgi:hypothetical protein